MQQIADLGTRVHQWRINQGFYTPSSLTPTLDIEAKLTLLMEEVGEAITGIRKADTDNIKEELVDNCIRCLDLMGAFNFHPLTSLTMARVLSAKKGDQSQVGRECEAIAEIFLGMKIPRNIDTEKNRRRLIVMVGRVNRVIFEAIDSAKGGMIIEFERNLGIFFAINIGLLHGLGFDYMAGMEEKHAINEKRPKRNGKVSSI